MKYIQIILAMFLAFSAVTLATAMDKPLDFWDEEIRLFGVAQANQHVDAGLERRMHPNYWYHWPTPGFDLDHAIKRVGDLSVVYTPAISKNAPRFGFVSSLWGETWTLSPDWTLRMWIKVDDVQAPREWTTILVDANGEEARGVLSGTATGGKWTELSLTLSDLEATESFDWSDVKLCEFEAGFGPEVKLWFDGIRFENAEQFIGVTDKPLAQRMAEARTTRAARIENGFRISARKDPSPAVMAFAKMYLNEDLEKANQMLRKHCEEFKEKNHWGLLETPLYCRFYYLFSNRAGQFPGRMEPETEKILLDTIWGRTKLKNDIHWARQSTWWMDGSENHDLNARASNLVSSRIFMNEPDYKDRVYPDYGFGGGYEYGPGSYYGKGIDPESRHVGGRANLSDGKEYTASDHYEAWLAYLKEYFRERARRGFFLENSSHGYSKHSYNMIDLAYQYGGDEELKQIVGDFMTLYWADWAQKAISGVHGGPKTRHHYSVGGYDSTYPIISFYMGGATSGYIWNYWNLINDYQLPAIVWHMALDREGMGSFVYRARGIGEEENVWPRPLGTERTLLCDTESRFLKYTYVTPDYTLGTQMDHPAAAHSHLSCTGRWHGMTFAQTPDARVVPVRMLNEPTSKGQMYDMEIMLRTAQHEDTLIVQQSPSWLVINPDWFPGLSFGESRYHRKVGIWVGTEWDRVEEQGGWLFLQKGNAYAAVRPVLWDEAYEKERVETEHGFNAAKTDGTVRLKEDCWSWSEDKTLMLLEDRFSPVIIEAGRKEDYSTLEGFMADVMDNPLTFWKTVVSSCHVMVYTPCGEDAPEFVFNATNTEIPMIGGKHIDYSYPMTFDSPYLKSEYKSGIIEMEFSGEHVRLDFSDAPWWAFWR